MLHHLILGKVRITLLKFVVIFSSATDVSIFTIDPLKVLISFNSGTFDFFFSKIPSTVILQNHCSEHVGKKKIIVEDILKKSA